MSRVNTQLRQVVEKTHKRLFEQYQIMPVKTDRGILVGNVLIVTKDAVKDLYLNNELIYIDVSLNAVTITLANLLAKHGVTYKSDTIYRADHDYGKWLQESQFLRAKYQSARKKGDDDRADIYLARYCTARDKAKTHHSYVLGLLVI